MAKLYFYYSAMNAGKSTTLLQSNYNYLERGMGTVLLTPELDFRVEKGVIASRIGLKAKAYAFKPECNLYSYVENVLKTKEIACVLVDEAQFLTKEHVLQLTDVVDFLNLPVLAYGLRSDYRGDVFEGSKYLLALADEFTEIKTVCHCGKKASMNLRFNEEGVAIKEGEQVVIGGNDQYTAVCRKHFKNPIVHNESLIVVQEEEFA